MLIVTLLLISSVTLGKLLNVSVPWFFCSKVVVGFKFVYTKERSRWKKRDQALRNRT